MARCAAPPIAALLLAAALAGPAPAAPFSPEVRARIDSPRPVPAGGHPALRITILQARGEDPLRRSAVRLPSQLQPAVLAAAHTCSRAQLRAERCPPDSRVGRAMARSPLVDEPLRGPVYLVDVVDRPAGKTGTGLPSIVARLSGGGLHLDLEGEQRHLATYRLLTVFRGLPPVPVRRFVLRFASRPTGPLQAVRWICAEPLEPLRARFVSHDGRRVSRTARVRRPACRERPRLRVSLDDLLGAGRPRTRIVVRRGPEGRAVRAVKVRLSELLRVPVADPWRGVRVRADGRPVPRSRWSLTRHRRLRVSTPGGADRIVAVLRGPATETSRRGRRVFGDARTNPALFAARMREVGGRATRVVLPIAARR